MTEADILAMLSHSQEFDQIKVSGAPWNCRIIKCWAWEGLLGFLLMCDEKASSSSWCVLHIISIRSSCLLCFAQPTDQPTTRPLTQLTTQPPSRPPNHSADHPPIHPNHPADHPTTQQTTQLLSWSPSHPADQQTTHPLTHPADHPPRHWHNTDILFLFAHKVREDELPELERHLDEHCQLPVKGGVENNYGKINILLQTYISRGFVESFSLVSDLSYVAQVREKYSSIPCLLCLLPACLLACLPACLLARLPALQHD